MKNRFKKMIHVTQRAAIVAVLSLLLAANALADTDPKTTQITQGTMSTVMGGIAIGIGIAHFDICLGSLTSSVASCLMSVGALAGGTGLLVSAGMNFAEAAKSDDGGGKGGSSNLAAAGLGGTQMFDYRSTLSDFPLQNDDLDQKTLALKEAADAKLREAEDKLNAAQQKLIAQGIDPQDALAHPEKYLTPEQLAQYDAGKAEIAEKMADAKENFDSETEMAQLLAGYDGASNYGGYGDSIGNQGGVFAPNRVDMDSFFKKLEFGMNHSAPGYYGNIKLETLEPESKKSLFERVSLKINSLM